MSLAVNLGALLFRNLGTKVFSVLLATGLWYAVNVAGRDAEIMRSVNVHFQNVPKDLQIVTPPVHSVRVWIAGPRGVLGTIESSELTLDYDLSGLGEGVAEFTVDRHDLSLPSKARLVRVWPASFMLRLERRPEKDGGLGAGGRP